MRVIAGSRKGHRLAAPPGVATRPTGDRVREAAFNLVGPVDGAAVLDLFAGSGAMGIEALSRGAARVVFAESSPAAARAIDANLDKLRLTGAVVARRDALAVLAEEAAAGREYDLVLADPPYDAWERVAPRLAALAPRVLARDGLLLVETAARVEPELPLACRTSRRYGAARLTLWEHE